MKETLREKVEKMRMKVIARRDQLELNILGYKKSEDWENAMKNDIKKQEFKLFLRAIDDVLA